MNTQEFKRKLTAVFSADVAGYSRLMGQDEAATVKTLEAYKQVMFSLIKQHRGRVIDSPGDNLLAEFASVVDAVQCGVAVQKELQARNAELPENRRMQFRIGINLGDVIEEQDRIYGDGVNIAARIEGLAEGGGICISGTAFDQIGKRLPLGYEYMGEQAVKNIEKPVRVYRVLMEPEQAGKVIGEKGRRRSQWRWAVAAAVVLVAGALALWNFYLRPQPIEPASKEKMAFPLPDKPSIAVLPFTNMSDDPKQEFFSDGITEEIINALSKVPQIFVIARNSSFAYKGKPVKIQQVAQDLGVNYVLEGSVRKEENRIRITAQLIDALTGRHIFSERYDRDLKEIFATQDEIAIKVLTALRVALTDGEIARLQGRGVSNIDAFFKLLEAHTLTQSMNKESSARARRLAEEALLIEPGSSRAYFLLASTHFIDFWVGPPKSAAESIAQGIAMAQKTIEMDPNNAAAYSLLGMLYVTKGEYDKAVEVAERGASMDPNSVTAVYLYGSTLMHASRCEDAIPVLEKAIRLSPLNPPLQCLANLSSCYAGGGRYEEAVKLLKRVLQEQPNQYLANIILTRVYADMGRIEDAQAQAAQVLRLNPKFSLESFAKTWRNKDPAITERSVNALRKAGLPEKPPLPLPDKPSIAVLPFVNMSDDPQQEYFSDGMTEDLITDLSKISGLFVIARNSTFAYKGKSVNVQQVSRELGVKYVLEGSVRRAGDQVRINAQLVDATTGQHLWAERYDGSMRDVFSLQDKINQKITAALAVRLTAGEKTLLTEKGTSDPAAYEEFLKGREHYLKTTKEDYAKAEACFKKAIELDPNFARAKASLALLYFDAASQGTKMREAFGMSMVEVRLRARHYLIEAMKKPNSITYQVAGLMDLNLRQWDAAISHLEKALALDPNDSLCHGHMSWVLSMAGKPAEGMEYAKNGMRLDPLNPGRHLVRIGLAHFCMGEWQEAVTAIEKALKLNPELVLFGTILGSAYAHLGRDREAEAAYHAYFERPYFDMFLWPFRDRRISDSFLEDLQKAGVPAIRIEWSRIYQVSTEDQLTGSDLRAFYYPSKTTGFSQGGIDWTLEIAKDGTATFQEPTLPGGKDTGRSWLESDRIWLQFQKHYSGKAYCSTIFKNPKGTSEGKNEYISFNDVWPTRFLRVR